MKSAKYAFAGAVLFVLGFAMATGVDANWLQAIYTPILLFGSLACFRRAEAIERTKAEENKREVAYKADHPNMKAA